MSHANQMTNTTGGISRLFCSKCATETLHQANVCGCGTRHVAYPVKTLTRYLRAHIHLPGSRPMRRRK